jgi:UDP-N-acetylmuramyl pentapeptide phosphotransferase/UDP-N-acetylglucosamine-1-phosphate transferase
MNAPPQIGTLAITFAAGCFATWLLCFPIVSSLRKRRVLDRPNERSSHSSPTPRGGGIAIVLVLVAGLLILATFCETRPSSLLAACTLILAAISFLDDFRPLAPSLRFLIHVAAAALLVFGLGWGSSIRLWSHGSDDFGGKALGVTLLVLLCLYLVGYANAFNFMDGINGLAAGQAAVSGLGVAALTVIIGVEPLCSLGCAGALLAGVAFGFIPHNFPRARVFMGDVGSVPLGFLCAGLAVVIAQKAGWTLIVPFVLLQANFILDTSITFVRRLIRGDKWYLPHREHFYQRLVRSGMTHTQVTSWEMLLQLGVFALVIAYIYLPAARPFIACAIVLAWLAFFAWAELRFRANSSRPVSTAGFENAQTGI